MHKEDEGDRWLSPYVLKGQQTVSRQYHTNQNHSSKSTDPVQLLVSFPWNSALLVQINVV